MGINFGAIIESAASGLIVAAIGTISVALIKSRGATVESFSIGVARGMLALIPSVLVGLYATIAVVMPLAMFAAVNASRGQTDFPTLYGFLGLGILICMPTFSTIAMLQFISSTRLVRSFRGQTDTLNTAGVVGFAFGVLGLMLGESIAVLAAVTSFILTAIFQWRFGGTQNPDDDDVMGQLAAFFHLDRLTRR